MAFRSHHPTRTDRGMTLVVVMGLLTVLTLAAAYSLRFVTAEARYQGDARHEREAFFAAEAGLAEGKERARLFASGQPDWTTTLAAVSGGVRAPDVGSAADPWFETIPLTQYPLTLASGGGNAAVDDSVGTADQERADRNTTAYRAYPGYQNVYYRVFLRDDRDEAINDPITDTNSRVWVISVGEVRQGTNILARSVVQAMIMPAGAPAFLQGCAGQRGGCSKDFNSDFDAAGPDLTGPTARVN